MWISGLTNKRVIRWDEASCLDSESAQSWPKILFLDEPTAGVEDLGRHVRLIKNLKASGVFVVLTTHYIEEAEEIADRIAVIDKGRILLVEEKTVLMERLGKQLSIDLDKPLSGLPTTLMDLGITLENNGRKLIYNYNVDLSDSKISEILLAIRSNRSRLMMSTPSRARLKIYLSSWSRRVNLNLYAIKAIYVFEMARTFRTPFSPSPPVISTILYFVVFGSAIGNRMLPIGDVFMVRLSYRV